MTGNWQEGDTGDLATQFLWCGGGEKIWGENRWTEVETENKDLSLDTQS